MRLFFIEWSNTIPELVEVVRDIKKRGHKILYWSGYNQNLIDKTDFPDTIFHDYYDALAGKPAQGVDDSEFPPPGDELIKKLYETESIVLTMMNKKYSRLSIGERKHFYYHLLKYWNGILESFRPDAVIFASVPHTVYDFVVYSLAQVKGIKTIMFDVTWISDRILVLNNYKEDNKKLKFFSQEHKNINYSIDDLALDIREYYKKHLNPAIDATPSWLKDYINLYIGKNILLLKLKIIGESIKDGSIFRKVFRHFLKKFRNNLKGEYESLLSQPDLNKNFIYVPLHFQPECTTSPIGGIFVEQSLMINILSASIPQGWLIYVKEHPTQWLPMGSDFGGYRYKNYYRQLAALKNVKLVSIKTSTYSLINNAKAVATVTGTAGWEAVLRLKPALIFGYTWYKTAPGIFQVRGTESCRAAINEIEKGYYPEMQLVIDYLMNFDKVSFHGYYDKWTKQASSLLPEQNKNNFLKILICELET